MSEVNVTINARQYRMACENGQEQHLLKLSQDLDQRIAQDRKSTRLNSSHIQKSRMPSSA